MKKILIFSLSYFPYVGGAEIAIKEITDRMPEIEWHMVTKRFGNEPELEKIGNVVVNRIGNGNGKLSKLIFQFSAARKAKELHKRHHYDATWAMMVHSAGVPAAIFKHAHPRVPFVLTLQEGDPIKHIEKTMRPLWLFFARAFTAADVVQPISNFLGEWARRRGFAGPLEVIPNGVDLTNFTQTYPQEELGALKTELGKKEGDVFLITTSRLVRKNAVDDVIRALPFLPENIKFLILGIGSEEETLRALAKGLGVEERVQFLGFVGHKEMPKYLAVSDIFIRPSRSEGMGNSFIEAMAAGLPVIATQEGGIADFLFDAKLNSDKETTGWAVDKDKPEQIAEAVKDILSDKDKTARIVEHAKEMAKQKYDWDRIAVEMRERVFKVVIKE